MRRLFAIALLVFATNAHADNIWQKAQTPPKPGMLSNDELHRQVAVTYQKARATRTNDPIFGGSSYAPLINEVDKLERHNAATSSDPRLRYDLGLVLAKLPDCKRAVVALENAFAFAKDHPFAEDGLFELAICYSKLGRHAEEESAYVRALEATDRQSHKAIVYSNLAEARMAQGKLSAGIDAAESAIELERDMASARYNLAILRDRSGDAFGALESARHAIELDADGEYIDGEGVFFEPAYEKHWYYALRDLALAERTFGPERTSLLMAALVDYRKWLEESDATDRFRKRCEENITRLEKQLKLKKP